MKLDSPHRPLAVALVLFSILIPPSNGSTAQETDFPSNRTLVVKVPAVVQPKQGERLKARLAPELQALRAFGGSLLGKTKNDVAVLAYGDEQALKDATARKEIPPEFRVMPRAKVDLSSFERFTRYIVLCDSAKAGTIEPPAGSELKVGSRSPELGRVVFETSSPLTDATLEKLLQQAAITYIEPSYAGLRSVPPVATAAERQAVAEARLRKAWRLSMAQTPLPNKGIFQATYPDKQWREVKQLGAAKAPRYPMTPRRVPRRGPGHGPGPGNYIGYGNDVIAQAPSGLISSATGSFDSVINVTSEKGQVNGAGPQIANAYTLQLNTNMFPSTVPGSAPGCSGWEQFVFQNDGGASPNGWAYIQYWLIGYGPNPPPGTGWWKSPDSTTDWYRNSTQQWQVPPQPITNLANLSLGGTVSASGDRYFFSTEAVVYSAPGDNSVNLAAGWSEAEFGVFGDANFGQANFNSNATIVTRTQITYGETVAPNCVFGGFTGESNNLGFGPGAPVASQPLPALLAMESSAGGATSNCAAVTKEGDAPPAGEAYKSFDTVTVTAAKNVASVTFQIESPMYVHITSQATAKLHYPTRGKHIMSSLLLQTPFIENVIPRSSTDVVLKASGDSTSISSSVALYLDPGIEPGPYTISWQIAPHDTRGTILELSNGKIMVEAFGRKYGGELP